MGDHYLCALLVGEFAGDQVMVRETFGRMGWQLLEARDRRGAVQLLEQHPVQVVVVEHQVARWNWKQALRDLRRREQPPSLVVTSRTADDSFWAEVLNLGGYDVLAQPFDANELQRVVESAGTAASASGRPLYRVAR